jgi:limonene 1,2-monooxygenase
MVAPMHVAETRAQARAEVEEGLSRWIYYNTKVGTLGIVPENATSFDDYVDALIEGGFAVIGTPDDAAAQIDRLQDASGGFGTFLFWGHDWAGREATWRSHELFAAEVMPRYRSGAERLIEAEKYALGHRAELAPKAAAARVQAREDYLAERVAEHPPVPIASRRG